MQAFSQARLGQSLSRLRAIWQDLQSTTDRLRRLPRGDEIVNTPASQETLADLDAIRHGIADAMRIADTEQMHGSRAGSALQQALIRAQLVHVADIESTLAHVVEDAARESGKQAQFYLTGGELTLDRTLYRRMLAPLEHLVRNAVVHGIEAVAERLAVGKSAVGRVTLEAIIDGTDLVVTLKDDGAGINRAAVNRQLLSDGNEPADSIEALRDVLCMPGFSTASEVNQVVGRGLGLPAVKQMVKQLGGLMSLTTRSGQGTSVVLRLPQQVVVNQVVLVQSAQNLFAIPVNFIQAVQTDSETPVNGAVNYQDHTYKLCTLQAMLGGAEQSTAMRLRSNPEQSIQPCVLIVANSARLGLVVDRVLGYREIIAQPLGPQLSVLQRYVGGSVLADGQQVLIVDLHRLVLQDNAGVMQATGARPLEQQSTAMIVDDSITMRTAAEQMLKVHGIQCVIARDGAEALKLLRHELPDVLLLDIDMPKLNGFDVLRGLRKLQPHHQLPVVMISTRDNAVDRAEAKALGVAHFIGKPYSKDDLYAVLSELGVASVEYHLA